LNEELLALLNPKVQHFAMAYGGEDNQVEEVALSMRRQVAGWKDLEGWRISRPDWILDMCLLALVESVGTNVCHWCKGRSGGMLEGKYVNCTPCGGSGTLRIKEVDRARLMDTTIQAWCQTWAKRHRRILAITDVYEDQLHRGSC